MMLYDWNKIYKEASGSTARCALIFKMLVNKEVPRNLKDPRLEYYYKSYKGTSFLLHPQLLVDNYSQYTSREISVYLALAARRNLGEFMASGKKTLDSLHSPVSLDTLEANRLLRIEDGEIHFLYEEV